MSDLVQLQIPKTGREARRPPWLRVKVTNTDTFRDVGELLDGLGLNTVCREARCPNIWECWGEHRTATFMIFGDTCTRACRYCSVNSGKPGPLDPREPKNVATAAARLALEHAVVTSVDRDDLPDYGSAHFAETIREIRAAIATCRVEVLIPDFMGQDAALNTVLDARPDVLGHNTETVPRLFERMRNRGDYRRTLQLLARVDRYRRQRGVAMTSKTGMMVGLGETIDEVVAVMDDLREVECDVLTIGQYLNPTKKHAPVIRFYNPDEFEHLREEGLRRGFSHIESGPLVRSSYHAHKHVPAAATE